MEHGAYIFKYIYVLSESVHLIPISYPTNFLKLIPQVITVPLIS